MSLQASLQDRLDAGGIVQGLVTSLTGSAGNLQTIDVGVSDDQIAGANASGADVSGIGAAVAAAAQAIEPLLARLPIAGDAIAPLVSGLALVEQVASGDLATQIQALLARVRAEVDGAGEAGLPAVLTRVAAALASAPAGAELAAVGKALLGAIGAGGVVSTVQPIVDLLPALDGTTQLLAGLMSYESVLSEAERLGGVMSQLLTPAALQSQLAAAVASFGDAAGGGTSLASFVSGVAPDDPAAAQAAQAAVGACVARVNDLAANLAASIGLAEATFVALDVDQVAADVATAALMVRTADVAATERVVAAAIERLRPLLPRDFGGVPAFSFDDLLADAHARVDQLAGAIGGIDVAAAVKPVSDGIGLVGATIGRVADLIERATQAVRAALAEVGNVVAALPIGTVVQAIEAALAPITAALDFIKRLVDEVKAAVAAAVTAVTGVLGGIESTVDGFKEEIEAFFGVARKFVEDLHLEQVLGTIADQLKAFSETLAKARMKPYFDTAIDAIGTTADVVAKVPFSILPDSVKQQVDDAVRPIKETDADAVEAEIEGLVAIGPDGHFTARADLEAAVAAIKAKFDELLQAVTDHDPRQYLQQIDGQLRAVATKVQSISPQLTLQPVRDAIDRVKGAIASFDIDRELAPISAAFAKVLAAIDEYSPAKLLQPLADRLNEARARLVAAIRLDRWAPAVADLHARALGLLGLIDPTQLRDPLANVFAEVQQFAGAIDDDALAFLGNIVCTLLGATRVRVYPANFPAVAGWLRGSAAPADTLAAHARATGDRFAEATAALQAIDPAAIAATLVPLAQALKDAIAAMPASDLRTGLQAAVAGLDPAAAFARASANRARFVAGLGAAAAQFNTLAHTGFSQATDGVARWRRAFAPAGVFTRLLGQLLARLGFPGIEHGLAGVVGGVFQKVTPDRLIDLVAPIIAALHDRVSALLDAVLTPVSDGIAQLGRAIADIDLAPMLAAVQGVVDDVKTQISALSPATLLGGPLGSFKALQADVVTFDPLGALLSILDSIKETIARVLGKLSTETLLATPLAVYDEILGLLRQIDPQSLLDPLFDELDDLAGEIDDGLDGTVTAFKRLQQSLPGDDGSGGGATVAVSVG